MPLKNIPDPGFAGDDGSADPALAAALACWAEDRSAQDEVHAALAGARLLVPVVAVLGEAETGPDGLRRDKTSDMAVPTLQAGNGRRALPAFTSVETLARWRSDARPVAVRSRQAAEAAFHEKADTLLIDMAGPVAFQLTGAPLRALAEGRRLLAAADDPDVLAAVRAAVAAEPSVLRAHLLPGGSAAPQAAQAGSRATDATVGLVLAPDADVRHTAARIATALSQDRVLRSRLTHGLDLALLPAETALPGEPLFTR